MCVGKLRQSVGSTGRGSGKVTAISKLIFVASFPTSSALSLNAASSRDRKEIHM